MASSVYKTLAKIVGIILIVAGAGAFWGGQFAASFIKEQLTDQAITLPSQEALDRQVAAGSITQETADALAPYAGETMTTGTQAYAYASMIHDHMDNAVRAAGLDPETATFSTVGSMVTEATETLTEEITADNPDADEETIAKMVEAEIANPLTEYESAERAAELTSLRYDTLLNGSTLRGMLLNAYGWGLVGTIANIAGIALIVVGALLTIGGFVIKGKKKA